MSMYWAAIVILTAVGLVLIAVDFYLPGFVLGSVGIVLMLVAVGVAHQAWGLNVALVMLLVETALGFGAGFAAIKYVPQTAAGKKMILARTQLGGSAPAAQAKDWIGREGVAQTLLRPAGVAMIAGQRVDVVAESGLIESGTAVKIVAVHENRLVVRKLT